MEHPASAMPAAYTPAPKAAACASSRMAASAARQQSARVTKVTWPLASMVESMASNKFVP